MGDEEGAGLAAADVGAADPAAVDAVAAASAPVGDGGPVGEGAGLQAPAMSVAAKATKTIR